MSKNTLITKIEGNNYIPEFSNVPNHAHENNHLIRNCNFKLLDSSNSFDLRHLESIKIHKKKFSLNGQNSSTELNNLT